MSLDLERLDRAARAGLTSLAGSGWLEDAYLAGAAALSLHLGHRSAHGLDFMSSTNRLRPPERRDLLGELAERHPQAAIETARDGYLCARLANGVAVRVYYYPYPLVDPAEEAGGVEIASLVDLGLMKLGALISRGARRDFVDLFFLGRRLPLADLLARSDEKFGHVRDFPLQALKALADFGQITGEPMPELSGPVEWDEIEAWARTEVRKIGRSELGLAAGPPDGSVPARTEKSNPSR